MELRVRTLLEGIDAVWLNSADARYFNYVKASIDQLVETDGSIPTWKPEENQLDNILLGRQLLLLYGVTQDKRYLKAATLLFGQLVHQPRTPSGGFWHKQRYPNQMWLDGLYMVEPFYAEYAALSHHPEAFSDITHQFVLMEEHARDPKTGLPYHGWDESKQERWANKNTGLSSQFWGRAMGWYMMALVDTLGYYPQDDAGRKQLITLLVRMPRQSQSTRTPQLGSGIRCSTSRQRREIISSHPPPACLSIRWPKRCGVAICHHAICRMPSEGTKES